MPDPMDPVPNPAPETPQPEPIGIPTTDPDVVDPGTSEPIGVPPDTPSEAPSDVPEAPDMPAVV